MSRGHELSMCQSWNPKAALVDLHVTGSEDGRAPIKFQPCLRWCPTLAGIRVTSTACQEGSFLGPTSREPGPMGAVGCDRESASSLYRAGACPAPSLQPQSVTSAGSVWVRPGGPPRTPSLPFQELSWRPCSSMTSGGIPILILYQENSEHTFPRPGRVLGCGV